MTIRGIGLVGLGVLHFFAAASLSNAEPRRLRLGEVVSVTLENNPSILNACDAVSSAQYGVDIAAGEFDPQFNTLARSGLGSDTQTSQSTVFNVTKKFSYGTEFGVSAGTVSTENDFYRSFMGFTISQSLFRGWGPLIHTAGIKSAENRILLSKWQLLLLEEEMVLEAINAFYRIIGQKALIGILGKSQKRSEQLLRAAKAKVERGLATKMDVFAAQTQLAGAKNALLDAKELLAQTKDELKLLMGEDMASAIDVRQEIIPVAVDERHEDIIRAAMEKRIEVKAMVEQINESRRDAVIAERNIMPDVRIGVNFARTGRGGSFGDSLGFNESTVNFLASASIPLSRDAIKAKSEQARIEVIQKQRTLYQLRRRIVQEVRRAQRHLANVSRRISHQETLIRAATDGLELAKLRFDRGYATAMDLSMAETNLMQAQKDAITTRIEHVIASLKLRKAAGLLRPFIEGLLPAHHMAPACHERHLTLEERQ